jgi:hypothetical protein
MRKTLYFLPVLIIICLHQESYCQNQVNFDLGEITPTSFNVPDSPWLKGAAAVFIADVGSCEYVSHSTGKFTTETERHVRIKIQSQAGFDVASFSLPVYQSFGNSQKVTQIEAFTYNLENGVVIKSTLQQDQVFTDKKSKHYSLKKFSMPSVKEGSIIDVEYHISSDFTGDISSWYFQGEYPRIRSEFNLLLPVVFGFNIVQQARFNFSVDTTMEIPFSYSDVQNMGFTRERSKYTYRKWEMKNVPGLKKEPFTTSLGNHWARLSFYDNYFNMAGNQGPFVVWSKITGSLLENEYFGELLYEKNNWMNDEINTVIKDAKDPKEKAKRIYDYMRDNFRCTDESELFLTDGDLRKIFKEKQGSVADINLLLVAMLYHVGIEASPVILSTIQNGRTFEWNPILEKYNKTIAVCLVINKVYYLDASDKFMAFGKIPFECYNGHARIIRGNSLGVNLSPDSVKEIKHSKLLIINDSNGKWSGTFSSTLGFYQSAVLRKSIKEKGINEVVKSIQLQNDAILTTPPEFENIDNKDECIRVSFKVEGLNEDNNNIVYINPVIGEIYTENPFKNEDRLYPVEMPYAFEESYDSEIDIPSGYIAEDIPETYQILLNGGDGLFEYIVTQKPGSIIVHSRIVLHKAIYPASEYADLRDFFKDIVKKHNQQIVFKRK